MRYRLLLLLLLALPLVTVLSACGGKGGGSNGSLGERTDLLVTVNVVVPQKLTKEAKELLEQYAGVQPESPREHLGKATGSRG